MLAALAVGGAITITTSALAVANGEDASAGAYTFATKLTMTDIERPDGTVYDSACSGALIDEQWIISAGHCFHDGARNRVSGPPRYQVTATIGRTHLNDDAGHEVDVNYVVQAPDRDMAIARLAEPVTDVEPLAVSDRAPQAGDTLRIAGWGATSSDGKPTKRLQTGQFKVATVDKTTVLVNGFAPAENTSACPYDSGAPFFVEHADGSRALVSTEVGGPDCPHSETEETARVDNIANWINSRIR